MTNNKILIYIPTFEEAQNILRLIKEIRNYVKNLDILIINDKSQDNTYELIKKLNDKNLKLIERPKKNGLGTAQVMSILYSIKHNYDVLITMDADFSHDPCYLPQIIKNAGKNNFVIGSRFIKGGKSDYKGMRKLLSIIANFTAQKLLKIKISEFTTSYRAYDVNLLKKIPFNYLKSKDYSLFVTLVWLMNKLNANLIEVPIHFKDRNKGKSKIPKFQIFVSAFDLFVLKFKDIFWKKYFNKNIETFKYNIECKKCKNEFHILIEKNKFKCLSCNNKIIL